MTQQEGLDQHPRPSPVQSVTALRRSQDAAAAKSPCTPSPIGGTGSNGDEARYPNRIGNFHKGLPHDGFGEVDLPAYATLLNAVGTNTPPPSAFRAIALGLGRPLTNPQAGLATDQEGPDPKTLTMRSAPRLDSAEEAAEGVELYWMALLRDVPFIEFESHPLVADAAKELSTLQDFTGPATAGQVTPATIFRGCEAGNLRGPLLSQFLLKDISYGALTISQREQTVAGGVDWLTDFDDWLCVQNGTKNTPSDILDGTPRYIRNMRDLGQYVHVDALYEAYLNACLILLHVGAPFDPGNPYFAQPTPSYCRPVHPVVNESATQIGFGTFGGPHILSLVCEVATRALKAVWYQKWFIHRRLRPEAYAGLIQVHLQGVSGTKKSYPIHKQILNSKALAETYKRFGSYLLPMAFPEGSPTHPAYGAGHATVAGACVTVLKAWFDEDWVIPQPVVPTRDGTGLVSYVGPNSQALTVGGELNKVAANIAIGRNMAGVHWRSDYYESLRLGESVALCILKKQKDDYHDDYSFSLTTFDGKKVSISKAGVKDANGKDYPLPC